MSQWCHITNSSSVTPFSSCPQSFLASGSFPMSWLLAQGGQSTRASVSAPVLPMNIQGLFPSGLTDWISLLSKGLSRVLQHHSSKASILWRSAFFKCTAAAAAKLLQSCPTLCDPTDGSPPGSPVPGISRQEHGSGLPFPSPMHESEKWKWSRSVTFNS